MCKTIPGVRVSRSRPRTFLAAVLASAAAAMLTIAAPAHAQSTGIAVCDDFLAKYEACIVSKVPAAQKAMFKGQLDQTRRTWAAMTKNAATKSSLEDVCKQSIDQIKVAFQPYGCAF
jgi:hypothetical protein